MKKTKPVPQPIPRAAKVPNFMKSTDRFGNSRYGSGEDLEKIIEKGG